MKKPNNKPLGIRNNNPGNLEWGSPWQGLRPDAERTDPRFCQFTDPIYGVRAIAMTLITYQDKRKAKDGSKIDELREFIERWAPDSENDVAAYTNHVNTFLRNAGVHENVIDVHNYNHLRPLVEGIIRHENGKGPLVNNNGWYSDDVIDEGLRRAGVTKNRQSRPEVIAAAAVGTGGAADVVNVASGFFGSWNSAGVDITSGEVVRIVFGVGTVLLAGWIAYNQYKRNKLSEA